MDNEEKAVGVTDVGKHAAVVQATIQLPVDEVAGLPGFAGLSGGFGRKLPPVTAHKYEVIGDAAMVNAAIRTRDALARRIQREVVAHILMDSLLQINPGMAQ